MLAFDDDDDAGARRFRVSKIRHTFPSLPPSCRLEQDRREGAVGRARYARIIVETSHMEPVSEVCLKPYAACQGTQVLRCTGRSRKEAPTDWFKIRKTIGMAGAVVLLLLSVVLIDHLVSRFTVKQTELHLVRGGSLLLTGPMPEKAERIEQLTVVGLKNGMDVQFVEAIRGFWLGTPMWRASIHLSESVTPGVYFLRIMDLLGSRPHPGLDITLHVYADADGKRKGSGAYLERWTGISLGKALTMLLPLLAVLVGMNYFASHHVEQWLAGVGRAEIYMVKKDSEETLIAFSLGRRNGAVLGERLIVSDLQGVDIGEATVLSVTDTDGVARLEFPLENRAIHMVRLVGT